MHPAEAPVYVVIMAGGGGTRLWPHSRRKKPKQFLALLPGGETLLAATVRRTLPLCPLERTLVVTAAAQVAEVRRCVPHLPVDNILVEPIGRNTAPCIGLAAVWASRRDPDAVLCVLPSDHYVAEEPAFRHSLQRALEVARQGHIVTIGIRPTHPETGYGYIEAGPPGDGGVSLVEAFVEKPDAARAAAYLLAGNYLWNSGMFFFPAQRVLAEIRRQLPPLGELLDELRAHPERLGARYPEAPAISIDYAVMEGLGQRKVGPAAAIRVLPGDFGWNDVGSFAALADLHPLDRSGNHVVPPEHPGRVPPPILVKSRGNIVWSDSAAQVTAVGVDDLVIAVTDDAILIVPRSRAQEVRDIVAVLEKDKDKDKPRSALL